MTLKKIREGLTKVKMSEDTEVHIKIQVGKEILGGIPNIMFGSDKEDYLEIAFYEDDMLNIIKEISAGNHIERD